MGTKLCEPRVGIKSLAPDITRFNRSCKESKLRVCWRNSNWRLNPTWIVLIYVETELGGLIELFIAAHSLVKIVSHQCYLGGVAAPIWEGVDRLK